MSACGRVGVLNVQWCTSRNDDQWDAQQRCKYQVGDRGDAGQFGANTDLVTDRVGRTAMSATATTEATSNHGTPAPHGRVFAPIAMCVGERRLPLGGTYVDVVFSTPIGDAGQPFKCASDGEGGGRIYDEWLRSRAASQRRVLSRPPRLWVSVDSMTSAPSRGRCAPLRRRRDALKDDGRSDGAARVRSPGITRSGEKP